MQWFQYANNFNIDKTYTPCIKICKFIGICLNQNFLNFSNKSTTFSFLLFKTLETIMVPWMLPLIYSLIFLQSSPSSFAKFPPSYFPSSIIRPETSSLSSNNELYKTKYFTQILDHFNYNPQSYQTFQQRYLINDTFWGGPKINAPIFVYTGNEGNIEWFAQNTGFMYDIAPEFKALIVFLEVTNPFRHVL